MKRISLGILAHVDSGKTTLSEALMYCSGNLKKPGRVDRGDAFLDTFSLERDRGITIFSKQAVLPYKQTEFTLIDTPGHVDFSAETERALQVVDYAVLVISGTDGVQSHTRTLWNLLAKYRVPCFIFVNKMDLAGSDRGLILAELRAKLSDSVVDFESADRDENIALCDDSLLDEYYKNGTLTDGDVIGGINSRRVFPCMFGSALKLDGIDKFLECLYTYTEMPDYGSEFSAKVFKISEDAQKNRLSFMKITGGSLRVRDVLPSRKNVNGEKVTQIRVYSGARFTSVEQAQAGTVCAVTGVSFTRSGDGLGTEQNSGMPMLEPVLSYTVILPEGVDRHTAFEKLKILEGEDPSLNLGYNSRTGQLSVRLMGEVQLEILSCLIRDRFGFEVSFGEGEIRYKETIASTVEGVGHFEPLRHYAEVHLLLKPGKRDSGLVFNTACREDLLDKNWQRLILTHLYEKTHVGVLTGAPITDMEITLTAGKAHPKHTEGGDFRQATYRAVRQGLRCAESILLEPVYSFTLEVPSELIGRAMADIQQMHGSFEPPVVDGEFSVLSGCAPVSTMQGYSAELTRYTRGRGRLSLCLKGYEPCHNSAEVIAASGYDPDADIDNPCDSVFCSHGAGHVVKYDEVKSRMHLSATLSEPKAETASSRGSLAKYSSDKDFFAADKELMRIFEQTYGPVRRKGEAVAKVRVKAPSQQAPGGKRKTAPGYDGTEYVLVDGYNVIFSWDFLRKLARESIDDARSALVNTLCNYRGYRQCELILVFDAYKVKGNDREIEKTGGITIVYTKEAETADMYIEKASLSLSKHHRVSVVTSDGMEQLIILGNGALRVPSRAFLDEVRQAQEEIRAIIAGDE